jgi:hypothetical protein
MTDEREKAAALVSSVRDVLKEALADLEAALEDHEEAKATADRLIATYGLEPFIRSDGQLGIHFMELSHSTCDREETLAKQVSDEIAGCCNADGAIAGEDRTHLRQWRDTLAGALSEIDAALSEPEA